MAYGTVLCNRVSRNRFSERGHHRCQKNATHYTIQGPPGVSQQLLHSVLTPLNRVEVNALLHELP
jgi:hypothetical protein